MRPSALVDPFDDFNIFWCGLERLHGFILKVSPVWVNAQHYS